MVATFRVQVVTDNIAALAARIASRAPAVVQDTALAIGVDAANRAPVKTGALKASIAVESDGPMEASVVVGVDYAVYQEYGTYKMAAHPFLTPAVEAHRQSFYDAMSKIVE